MVDVATMLRWHVPPCLILCVLLVKFTGQHTAGTTDFMEIFSGAGEATRALRAAPRICLIVSSLLVSLPAFSNLYFCYICYGVCVWSLRPTSLALALILKMTAGCKISSRLQVSCVLALKQCFLPNCYVLNGGGVSGLISSDL